MTSAAPALRVFAPSKRAYHMHDAALIAVCVAADAVAAGILLLGTSLPRPLEGLAAAALHGTAALFLSCLASARPSRRWLCVMAVLAVPLVGTAVSTAALATRGRGSVAMRRHGPARRRQALTIAAMQCLRDALSPYDVMDCGDE